MKSPDNSGGRLRLRPAAGTCNRATFLKSFMLGVFAATRPAQTTLGVELPQPLPRAVKGKPNSKVHRWDVVTIGNLSRNRYWGEPDDRAVRSAICTCTVVQGEGFRLVVDPSIQDARQMATELDRRTGLSLSDVSTAFVTHEHADHWFGLQHFTAAKWLAAPAVAAALNQTGKLPRHVEPVTGTLFGGVNVIHTPGHTASHHSLQFHCDGLSVVLAGDAVATRDFWRERRGYFNATDFELSARTMEKIQQMADIVVPGHDNYFLTATPGSRQGSH